MGARCATGAKTISSPRRDGLFSTGRNASTRFKLLTGSGGGDGLSSFAFISPRFGTGTAWSTTPSSLPEVTEIDTSVRFSDLSGSGGSSAISGFLSASICFDVSGSTIPYLFSALFGTSFGTLGTAGGGVAPLLVDLSDTGCGVVILPWIGEAGAVTDLFTARRVGLAGITGAVF